MRVPNELAYSEKSQNQLRDGSAVKTPMREAGIYRERQTTDDII